MHENEHLPARPRHPLARPAAVLAILLVPSIALAAGRFLRTSITNREVEREAAEMAGELDYQPPFDLSNLRVPRIDVREGGPPKDAIPALFAPEPKTLAEVAEIPDDERAVVVTVGDSVRAYPLRVLRWHEIVNDTLGGQPIAVIFCPLCDSVSVLDRAAAPGASVDAPVEYGVSGRLWQSNVLMFDRATDALWSQVGGHALSGPQSGERLAHRTGWSVETMGAVRDRAVAPDVVRPIPGLRPYHRDPYVDIKNSPVLWFPVSPLDRRLPDKTLVLAIAGSDGTSRAWTLDELARRAGPDASVEWSLDAPGGPLTVAIATGPASGADDDAAPAIERLEVLDAPAGSDVMHTWWFAWGAARPDTVLSDGVGVDVSDAGAGADASDN